MPVITSRDHPLVKQLIKLEGSAQYRKKTGLTLLDGINLIQIYCSILGKPENLIVSESYYEDADNKHFIDIIFGHKPPKITIISNSLFRAISPVKTPIGILALISIPALKEQAYSRKVVFSVLLEAIQDPGNLGSILRSAAAAGVNNIYLSKHCTDAWSPKTLRAGMGAHFFLHIHENSDLKHIAQQFKGTVIATSIQASKNLFEISLVGPTAFIFGNEGAGLSKEMIQAADENIVIPMPGKTESLNAAAAAAICFFEKVRQERDSILSSNIGTK
ncbi:TrmH family RNA methyltransferase [Nitrosomonas supralitoralis]|uniref:RNA methyltransferase n=1 Tax=Nitrosomonas supralitoralis TaxID=2116706 RepID=A0A2P7NXC3_9PROT|nr:RNA methyltransferase [Nitrosomonas supralitoralis]PSJ18111.1 RNA methyltransferase [Nitrosomonas supralitoralis]